MISGGPKGMNTDQAMNKYMALVEAPAHMPHGQHGNAAGLDPVDDAVPAKQQLPHVRLS